MTLRLPLDDRVRRVRARSHWEGRNSCYIAEQRDRYRLIGRASMHWRNNEFAASRSSASGAAWRPTPKPDARTRAFL